MANYQPPHDSTLNHRGEKNTAAQLEGSCHPAEHAQSAMDNTTANSLPTHTPGANQSEEVMGAKSADETHLRFGFHPTHTCATCKETAANNYSLEKHAAKKRHKAFLCTCGTSFGRLGSLNRHIAAQAGPKHYCTYCDNNKGFPREDKLIDHLRDSHKFGKNAIAYSRSNARVQVQGNGHAPLTIATTGAGQLVSTSASYDAGSGALSVGQTTNSAGTSAGPPGGFDGCINNFPMFSAAELQPFAPVEDYSWTAAAEDFASFDLSGIDFSGVDFANFDVGMDLSGMDNHL